MNANLSYSLILKCVAHSLSPSHSFPLFVPCRLLPRHFQRWETIISLSVPRGFHDPWEWWVSQDVKQAYLRTFMCAGGLENEAAAAKNHTDFEVGKIKIYPTSSKILLIFLTCRKFNSKNVNLQYNQLSEGNQLRIMFEYQEVIFNNIKNYP